MSETPKPLAGIKVLDISRVLAGPWCGQMLADMGGIMSLTGKPESNPSAILISLAQRSQTPEQGSSWTSLF